MINENIPLSSKIDKSQEFKRFNQAPIHSYKRKFYSESSLAKDLAFDLRFLMKDISNYQEAYKRANKVRTNLNEMREMFRVTQELASCLQEVESLLEEHQIFGIHKIVLNDVQSLSRHLEQGSSLAEMRFPIKNLRNFYSKFYKE